MGVELELNMLVSQLLPEDALDDVDEVRLLCTWGVVVALCLILLFDGFDVAVAGTVVVFCLLLTVVLVDVELVNVRRGNDVEADLTGIRLAEWLSVVRYFEDEEDMIQT
ncbi:hypothetical protein MAM1_0032c02456 [Mucor ambiguus]|uniref:Uncharacterized protein n=1 Tax=Mucor ambiguus TaxID=91626 RepID=A0A0C9M2K3_9FUNG|nr:hypothetical protein MAM1_0032c02456 [Mucor ambiguus]